MALKGSLNEASLPDVLQLLVMGNKTGCLSLTVDGAGGIICFINGRICHASVDGRDLGTEDSVYAMFKWTHGQFSFDPGVTPPAGAVLVSVDPQGLLLEGARRVDEWSLVEKRIPSFDVVFALDRQRLLRNSIALTDEQQLLLPLIDGFRDVTALLAASKLGEFATGKALFGLLSGAFIVAVGSRETEAPVVSDSVISEHRNLGIAFYKARMYSDAGREFRRITQLRPSDSGAAFFLGLIALRDARWNDAVASFQTAAVSTPRASSIFVNLAYAYERLGQYGKARLALDQVIARGSRPEPLAHVSMAALALHRGDLDSAAASLGDARQAWREDAPQPTWFHYAGVEATMRGNLDRAVEILADGVSRYPASAVLLNNLSAAYEASGKFAEARAASLRAATAGKGAGGR
ncbi:MAG: DUF4388 domain-containing protein [Gemmatimonadota bacterium]|nr:DUF4388 domain-containing protein [Gemmatimonadota bacterium]